MKVKHDGAGEVYRDMGYSQQEGRQLRAKRHQSTSKDGSMQGAKKDVYVNNMDD